MTMRILHVWDVAGVAYVLAKYQQLLGFDSKVLTTNVNDKYGIRKFYGNYGLNVKPKEFIETFLTEAEVADIIHIHSLIEIVIRARLKFLRSKKIILHYHGSDIRRAFGGQAQIPSDPIRVSDLVLDPMKVASKTYSSVMGARLTHRLAQKLSNVILVASPELLDLVENAHYLPIPVDTDHFNAGKLLDGERKEALMINTEVSNMLRSIDYCRKNKINLDIEIYDRTKYPIMYLDMPSFLRVYRTYIDIRFIDETLLQHLSTTALQSLACGLKVINYQLNVLHTLPREHDPINVVNDLLDIYSKCNK